MISSMMIMIAIAVSSSKQTDTIPSGGLYDVDNLQEFLSYLRTSISLQLDKRVRSLNVNL
jgi:hypothetical protein